MNPQVEKLVDMLKAAEAAGAPRLWELPPGVARRAADEWFVSLFNPGGPVMAETRAVDIPGPRGRIAGRLYVPEGGPVPGPGLLYLHGGGWVIGSPDTHDRLTRELAAGAGMRVLSIHYGLAPEQPFPDGLDDCVAAARFLEAEASSLGIDGARLAIGGDSAGANLAAATLLRVREEGGPRFRAAMLIYGRFAEGDTPSMVEWGDRDLILSRQVMDWFAGHYLGRHRAAGGSTAHPHLAPLLGDLAGMPPASLVVGTLDPLRSDSELFAAALRRVGVPADLHLFPDAPHGFVQMFMLDMAHEAVSRLAAFARAHVA